MRGILMVGCFVLATAAQAKDMYSLDSVKSRFAILTKRGGIASGLAHDHLIVAKDIKGTITYDKINPAKSAGKIQIDVNRLMVDENGQQEKYLELLKSANLEIKNDGISDSDRAEITEHMLDENQLNAKAFPEISGELSDVEITAAKGKAKLKITIRGKSQTIPVNFTVKEDTDKVSVSLIQETSFSAFGIDPYSALLGAVRNKDDFFIILDLQFI